MYKPKGTKINRELRKVIYSKDFKLWKSEVEKEFAKHGAPIPDKPVEPQNCMCHPTGWYKLMWEKVRESENNPEFLEKKNKIVGDKKKLTGEEMEKIWTLESEYFLHPIGDYISYYLREHLKINSLKDKLKYKVYYDFISDHILQKVNEYVEKPTISYHPHLKRGIETKAMWLKIEEHMTAEDVKKSWSFVKRMQKDFYGSPERFSSDKNLERNVRILEIYHEMKNVKIPTNGPKVSIYTKIAVAIEKEFPDQDISQEAVRSVIKRGLVK